MKKLVETDRWKDSFFMSLSPYSKLMLSYLYDCCNFAGIFDTNFQLMEVQLKMDKKSMKESILELKPLLLSDGKNKLFIKDYLKQQLKLPLIRGNEEHDLIISKLEHSLDKFGNPKEIIAILENVKDKVEVIVKEDKKKREAKEKFVVPSYEEFEAYFLTVKPDAETERMESLYNHYVSVGWVVANKPVVDWQACIRKNKNNNYNQYQSNGNNNGKNYKKESRTDTTMSVMDKLMTPNNNQPQQQIN